MQAVFNVPSTVICGAGALSELAGQLQRLRVARVLLVTDEFMVNSGLAPRVESDLRQNGFEVESHFFSSTDLARYHFTPFERLTASAILLAGRLFSLENRLIMVGRKIKSVRKN